MLLQLVADRCSYRKMLFVTIVLVSALVNGETVVSRTFVKTGRYNPQLFGGSGKYMPDDRGKYRHMVVPYDGGYGDRGERYINLKERYWQQDGETGKWVEPDSYEQTAPYAEALYRPSPAVPSYILQEWSPGYHGYADDYQHDINGWRIIQFQWSKEGKTRYSYLYETENKILAEEIGKLAKLSDNSSAIRVDGFYQYQGDDGTIYGVDYVANENGFFPKGKHIHKSIQNVLNFLMKNTTKVLVP